MTEMLGTTDGEKIECFLWRDVWFVLIFVPEEEISRYLLVGEAER